VVADNDYRTTSPVNDISLNIDSDGDGTGDRRTYTHLFIKGTGITAVSIPNPINFVAPASVFAPTDLLLMPTEYDGFQNLFIDATSLSQSNRTQQSVSLTVGGAGHTTAEVLVMRELDFIADRETRVSYDMDVVDLGITQRAANSTFNKIPPLGNTRDKMLIRMNITFRQNATEFEEYHRLLRIRRDYRSFIFALDPVRFPQIVCRAIFEGNITTRRISRWEGNGVRATFTIREA